MGYYDGLIETSFHETIDEKVIFSPYGNLGRTYCVTKEQAKEIKDFLRKFYKGTLIVTVLFTVILKLYGIIALFFVLPYYYMNIKKYVQNCEVNEKDYKTTFKQRLHIMSSRFGLKTCIFLLMSSVLMLLATTFVLITASDIQSFAIGLSGLLLFGLCLVQSVMMIYILNKPKNDNG